MIQTIWLSFNVLSVGITESVEGILVMNRQLSETIISLQNEGDITKYCLSLTASFINQMYLNQVNKHVTYILSVHTLAYSHLPKLLIIIKYTSNV